MVSISHLNIYLHKFVSYRHILHPQLQGKHSIGKGFIAPCTLIGQAKAYWPYAIICWLVGCTTTIDVPKTVCIAITLIDSAESILNCNIWI